MTFFGVICVIFLLQSEVYTQHVTAVGSVVDVAKEIVSGVATVIDAGLSYGLLQLESLNLFLDSIYRISEIVNDIITPLLNSTESLIDSELNKLQKVVNDDGKDFLVCLDQNKETFWIAEQTLLRHGIRCVIDRIRDILPAIKTIMLDVQSLQEDVNVTALYGIDMCDGKTEEEALGCLVDVFIDVIEVADNIPDVLNPAIEKLTEIYRKSWPIAAECFDSEYQDFFRTMAHSLDSIAICFRKKT